MWEALLRVCVSLKLQIRVLRLDFTVPFSPVTASENRPTSGTMQPFSAHKPYYSSARIIPMQFDQMLGLRYELLGAGKDTNKTAITLTAKIEFRPTILSGNQWAVQVADRRSSRNKQELCMRIFDRREMHAYSKIQSIVHGQKTHCSHWRCTLIQSYRFESERFVSK